MRCVDNLKVMRDKNEDGSTCTIRTWQRKRGLKKNKLARKTAAKSVQQKVRPRLTRSSHLSRAKDYTTVEGPNGATKAAKCIETEVGTNAKIQGAEMKRRCVCV